MNRSLTHAPHDILQLLIINTNIPESPGPDINAELYGCKVADYVVYFFPVLPLTFFHTDVSPDGIVKFIIVHLVVFLAAFFHQVCRAVREYILWKTYTKRHYQCISILSDSAGKKSGRHHVALIPMPSIAACRANMKNRSNRVLVLNEQKLNTAKKQSDQVDLNQGIPIKAAAHMAIGAHKLVQTAESSSAGDAAKVLAVSSMASSVRVPSYCVRTRGGYIGCTCSPYSLNTHGKPLCCTNHCCTYAFVACLEACLAVPVVVGIASFNGWMAVAAVLGGALGHLMTHWRAVTVVEVQE